MASRRSFVVGAGALLLAGPTPCVGQERPRRIALVDPSVPVARMIEGPGAPAWGALIDELRRLGHLEGRTVAFDRWSDAGRKLKGDAGHDALTRKVLASRPDAIVTRGYWLATHFMDTTRTIPIVSVADIADGDFPEDAMDNGNVMGWGPAWNRNVTGISSGAGIQLFQTQLHLLREIAPTAEGMGWLGTFPHFDDHLDAWAAFDAAELMGLKLLPFFCSGEGPFKPGKKPFRPLGDFVRCQFEELAAAGVKALLVSTDFKTRHHAGLVAELAIAHRMPAIAMDREYIDAGLLMVYRASSDDMFRKAARYLDRILRGADPSRMPVLAPTEFDLTVNLKTAAAMGLTLPPSIIDMAVQIIE